jgi:hypothetical protein
MSALAGFMTIGALGACQIGPSTLPVSSAHYSDAVRRAQAE